MLTCMSSPLLQLSRLRDMVAENARAMEEMQREWQVKLEQTRRIQEQQMEVCQHMREQRMCECYMHIHMHVRVRRLL